MTNKGVLTTNVGMISLESASHWPMNSAKMGRNQLPSWCLYLLVKSTSIYQRQDLPSRQYVKLVTDTEEHPTQFSVKKNSNTVDFLLHQTVLTAKFSNTITRTHKMHKVICNVFLSQVIYN
jgi:hypothetical protein